MRSRTGSAAGHARQTMMESSMLQFEWRIEPDRIKIATTADGAYWSLGSGGFGTVRLTPTGSMDTMTIPCIWAGQQG